MSVYESRIWRFGRALLPQSLRLKVRGPVVSLIAGYKQTVQKSYSANGEDLLIRSLIRDGGRAWYFDVGAGDPRIHSNTYALYLAGAQGVVIDANRALLATFGTMRPRDQTIWGAITTIGGLSGSVIYWTLDPWELSTTDPAAKDRALKRGSRLVSESQVPTIDINDLLTSTYPTDGRSTLLNIDIEGISFEVLNSIDFARFPFDYVLVERDAPYETFNSADGESAPHWYQKVASLGPTDAYARLGTV